MDYRFIRYDPRHRDCVLKLQTHLWGADLDRSSDYFRWKYEENPYLAEPLIYLALHGGRVVGMRGLWGAKWQVGLSGETVVIPCTGDTTIEPDHRERGLLRRLLRSLVADPAVAAFPYLLSPSTGMRTYHGSIKEGWRVIGTYDSVSRVPAILKSPPARKMRALARRFVGRAFGEKLVTGANALAKVGKITDQVLLADLARPDDMLSLAERVGSRDGIHHVRDRNYFAWRFKSPFSRYRFLYWQGETLEGYLVLGQRSQGIVSASIVDWEAVNEDVLRDLVEAAIRVAGVKELSLWTATLSSSMVDLLAQLGFAAQNSNGSDPEYRPSLLATCVDQSKAGAAWSLAGRCMTDIRNWDLRMIDSDSY